MTQPRTFSGRLAGSGLRAVVVLVLAVTLIKLAYLAFLSPFTLIEDEAFYWEWSLRPALSYYTKGPGIAWIIWLATHTLGTTEFAIRVPAVICGAIVPLAAARMAQLTSSDSGRSSWYATVCLLCAPAFLASSLIMTIDGPYAACWALAAWGGMRALLMKGKAWWLLMGAAVGAGFLMKYTIIALPISWIIFAAWRRSRLNLADRWPLWCAVGMALAAMGTLPVIIWNAQNDWPTIAHLLGHLGVKGGDMPVTQGQGGWRYDSLWTLSYIGGQIGMLGPMLLIVLLRIRQVLEGAHGEHGRYLVACAVPLLAFYFLISFVTEPEANWALGSGITLAPLAGCLIAHGLHDWRQRVDAWSTLPEPRPRQGLFLRRPQSMIRGLWLATLVIGIGAAIVIPALDPLGAALGRIVPRSRLFGAREMAAHVERLAGELPASPPPIVIAMHYGRAAQLRFYMKGHPLIYCSGRKLGHGRTTQYDFWADTNLCDPNLIGRSAVVVGGDREKWTPFFTSVGEAIVLDGDRKRGRPAFIARAYLGCQSAAAPSGAQP